jgi:hypothetical protein
MKQPIELQYIVTEQDYMVAARLHASRQRIRWFFWSLSALLVVLAILMLLKGDFVASFIAAIGAVWVASLLSLRVWYWGRKGYRNTPGLRSPINLRISPGEMQIDSAIGSSVIRHFSRVFEGPPGILCYLSLTQYVFIPRHVVESELQYRQILQWLKNMTLPPPLPE